MVNNNNKKGTCQIVDFGVLADNTVKLKERIKERKEKTIEHESDSNTNYNFSSLARKK